MAQLSKDIGALRPPPPSGLAENVKQESATSFSMGKFEVNIVLTFKA